MRRARPVRAPPRRPGGAGRDAAVEQAVGDVVERGLAAEQEELLEDEPDPPRPKRRQPPVGQAGDVVAGDPDRALGRPVEGAEEVQQRRLAGPRRPDDRDQLAFLDPEVDAWSASTGGLPG